MSDYNPLGNPIIQLYADFLEQMLGQEIEELNPTPAFRPDKPAVFIYNAETYHSLAQAVGVTDLDLPEWGYLNFTRCLTRTPEGVVALEESRTGRGRCNFVLRSDPASRIFVSEHALLYSFNTTSKTERDVASYITEAEKRFNHPLRRLGRWLANFGFA